MKNLADLNWQVNSLFFFTKPKTSETKALIHSNPSTKPALKSDHHPPPTIEFNSLSQPFC